MILLAADVVVVAVSIKPTNVSILTYDRYQPFRSRWRGRAMAASRSTSLASDLAYLSPFLGNPFVSIRSGLLPVRRLQVHISTDVTCAARLTGEPHASTSVTRARSGERLQATASQRLPLRELYMAPACAQALPLVVADSTPLLLLDAGSTCSCLSSSRFGESVVVIILRNIWPQLAKN